MPERDWAALGAEISAQLKAVAEKKPPHEILGVSPMASASEVHRAFDTWARKLHTDGGLRDAPKDIVASARRLLTALKEARELLLDPKKRQAHEATTAVLTAAKRAQEAEVEYMRGKIALSANRLQEAEDHFRAAVGLEPKNGLYLAYFIWVQFLRTEKKYRAHRLTHFLAEMERAAGLSPTSALVAYLTGMILKMQGNVEAAVRELHSALDLDSSMHAARSELELLARRRETGTYPQAPQTAPVQQGARRTPIGSIWPWGRQRTPK